MRTATSLHPHILTSSTVWGRAASYVGGPNVSFLAQSVIFDDLCTNFKHHEELDASNALVTLTKTAEGVVTGATLDTGGKTVSVVPITVPTSMVDKARTSIVWRVR